MNHEASRVRPKRTCVEIEESRAWMGFYRRVGQDPVMAAEVMAQLEADPLMKRNHLALYLCCKQSLRTHKAAVARNRRIGQFVRWLFHGVFVAPALALRQMLRQGGDIAVECLPPTANEPAATQVKRLKKAPEFAQAQSSFAAQAPEPNGAPSATSGEPSKPNAVSQTA
ncbi:hypothetical protein [Aquabacterium sp.]|jgi:hypothetical protein|uniref:hypothetical protein n=1 Tax=Aquabacterium sp. TaxID=1872578 RepID=UPI004038092D